MKNITLLSSRMGYHFNSNAEKHRRCDRLLTVMDFLIDLFGNTILSGHPGVQVPAIKFPEEEFNPCHFSGRILIR